MMERLQAAILRTNIGTGQPIASQARIAPQLAANGERGKCSETFCHRDLANILATEFQYTFIGGQRGKRLARINLTQRSNGLDSGSAAHMSTDIIDALCYG